MQRMSGLFAAVALLGWSAPALAQENLWQNQWYWGAQAGYMLFSTPTQSTTEAFDIGGHWLITRDRVAFHLAVDQIMFKDATTSAIVDATAPGGVRTVGFTSGRRIQGELYAVPGSGNIQVFAGGGFAIHQITDAVPQGTFATPQEQDLAFQLVDEASTKAFVVATGGLQFRIGRFAIYGKYQYMPEGSNFLITSEQHAFTGGLRIALTGASEDVTTAR